MNKTKLFVGPTQQRHLISTRVAASLGLCFVACADVSPGAVDEAAERDEAQARVRPGTDDRPPTFRLVAGPGFPAGIAKTTYTVRGETRGLGETLTLPAGASQIALNTSDSPRFTMSGRFGVELQAGEHYELVASLVDVRPSSIPTVGLGIYANPVRLVGRDTLVGVMDPSPTAKPTAVVPGAYTLTMGLRGWDGQVVQLYSGRQQVIDLGSLNARHIVRLEPPVRELPTSCDSTSWSVVARDSANGEAGSDTVSLAEGETLDMGMRSNAMSPTRSFAIRVIGSNLEYAFKPPTRAGVTTLRMGRIDVDDVRVAGGALVRGTYKVYAYRPNRTVDPVPMFVGCTPATNTGVDVPPGKYQVVVSFSTRERGAETQRFDVVAGA